MSRLNPANSISFGRKLFSPSITRQVIDGKSSVVQKTANDLLNLPSNESSSFRYDTPGMGLKSTQQLNVDWSNFSSHTFFNSAQVNVNVAFSKIIDYFPFDGTRDEIDNFLDEMTGFERYIYELFPKNKGYLNFNNSYIKVDDYTGFNYPELSRNRSGDTAIDPGKKSFEIEMHVLVPSASNDNQIIIQKISGSHKGFSLHLSESNSDTVPLLFVVSSGSNYLEIQNTLQKGSFSHIVAQYNRTQTENKLYLWVNGNVVTSSNSILMNELGFSTAPLLIGSGSQFKSFVPAQNFSGSIDELRIFHKNRSLEEIKKFKNSNVFSQDDLALYYKFNEPTGTLGANTTNRIVLDSSGNSLHSFVINYDASLRNTGSVISPIENEILLYNPVLFPGFENVISLNETLLSSASIYDNENPNLITKLVPPHYLQQESDNLGFETNEGTLSDEIDGSGIPGSLGLGSAQILSMLLYVWAKHFDEIKLFHEHFSNLLYVDYDKIDNIPDPFIPFLFEYYNLSSPNIFSNSSIDQFVFGENIKSEYGLGNNNLKNVQNEIWRRILINLNEILKSKGTVDAVKELIRCVGINPDNNFRIREYGGATFRGIEKRYIQKSEVSAMLTFTGSIEAPETIDSLGFGVSKPHLITNFLSSSRVEPGYPFIAGTFFNGISNNENDGLLTSGSWSIEGTYKLQSLSTGSHFVTQSLMRQHVTGTFSGNIPSGQGLWGNIIAISSSIESSSSVKYYSKNIIDANADLIELAITGVNIFDKNQWYVGVSFDRNYPSSSYTLYCGRQSFGDIIEFYSTSSWFDSTKSGMTGDITQILSSSFNASGTFIVVGSQSIDIDSSTNYLLNDTNVKEEARSSNFSGLVNNIRFWSRKTTENEAKERTINFKSLGVDTPYTNFNFNTFDSGSFERLRVDLTIDQYLTKSSNDGQLTIFDFSQNNFHGYAYGFEPNKDIIVPETFYFGQISGRIDEAESANKIRIRSLENTNDDIIANAMQAPLYELNPSEVPYDDVRFTIDFSIVDALNEDIIKIFSTLNEIDNAIGSASNMHSEDYPDLENLRHIYFNRLTSNIKLKEFFEFFKWFDESFGLLIEQIIPRKTNFLGINYVIESHMLERNKFVYKIADSHLTHQDKYYETTTIVPATNGVIS